MGHFDSLVLELQTRIRKLAATESMLLLLDGDLGVGKTQLTKELLASFGYAPAEVQSPTFLKLIEHRVPRLGKVLHLDLYRLDEASELQKLDLEAYEDQKLIIIEWPALFEEYLKTSPGLLDLMGVSETVKISITMDASAHREWKITSKV